MKTLLAIVIGAAALVAGLAAQPAPAVVHEIYAAWCAGKGENVPPEIADDTKRNVAAPAVSREVVSTLEYLDGFLIDFDFDKAQAKIVPAPTGPAIVKIDDGPPPLYLERFVLDPDFPAFLNCPKLESLSGS